MRSERVTACLHDWNTVESIDGYSLQEMYDLRKKIDDAIFEMIFDDPNQMFLFED